jgi:hypothetical protein
MQLRNFISANIKSKDGTISLQFINYAHIQRVFQINDIVYIELSDYTTLEVSGDTLNTFIERFVR